MADIGQEVEDTLRNNLISQVKQQTDSIYDALVEHKANAKLPEHIFRDYFLPYFAGQMPITKESSVVPDWISVAATPMSEVDIIDPAGETLFTVPSLFDTHVLNNGDREKGKSITDIYQEFELRQNGLPNMGARYLATQLAERHQSMIQPSVKVDEDQRRWGEIFKRYNITPTVPNALVTSTSDTADDVEYD